MHQLGPNAALPGAPHVSKAKLKSVNSVRPRSGGLRTGVCGSESGPSFPSTFCKEFRYGDTCGFVAGGASSPSKVSSESVVTIVDSAPNLR